MYPPLEDLPPKALAVDSCVRARVQAREEEKRRELEKQLAEQREVERQQALAEAEIKAEEQRQRKAREDQAELEAKRAEKAAQFRATVLGWVAFLLGVTGLSYVCYKYRSHGWLSLNKAKVSFGLAGLFIIYVAAMPYITIHQMKSAAETHDGEALSEHIEFPSVRQSLKDQMNAMFITKMAENNELRGNPFAAVGTVFAEKMVDSMVNSVVTPTVVARLMSGEKTRAGQDLGRASSSGRKPLADASMSYETLNKFVVAVKTDEGGEVKFVLRRRGLNWKLTEIICRSSDLI